MLGPACAFMASVTWAFGTVTYSRLSREYTPFAVNFLRAIMALPLFLVTALLFEGIGEFSRVQTHHWVWFSLSMFASYGVGDALFMWSTRSLGVPSALAIASTYPLFTTLAGWIFLHEGASSQQMMGLVATLIGVIVVILFSPKHSEQDVDPAQRQKKRTGLLLAFATALFWGLNSFAIGKGGRDLSAPLCNTIRMLVALLLSWGFSRIFARGTRITLPASDLRANWKIFVFEAFGGSMFYTYGLSHSRLVVGASLASLAPVISVPVAWLIKSEKVSLPRTAGVFLVVLGVWLLVS